MATKKEQIQRSLELDYTPVAGSSRAETRKLKGIQKNATRRELSSLGKTRFEDATSISQILENEDDEVMLQKELAVQNALLKQISHSRVIYRVLRNCQVSDRTALGTLFPLGNEAGNLSKAFLEANRRSLMQSANILKVLDDKFRKLKVSYRDREEIALIKLMRGGDFSGEEIFEETLRARGESIELMSVQLDWLRQQKEPDEIILPTPEAKTIDSPIDTPVQVQETETIESPAIEPPFPLSDWNIHFTSTPWSDLPSRLHPVDSSSKTAMIAEIEELTRTYRSIKPSSIVRAIAYHLVDKDTIQKALATRFRYSEDEDKDWVKVKRGGDRIGLLIHEEARAAIFCIEGRDVVYRKN